MKKGVGSLGKSGGSRISSDAIEGSKIREIVVDLTAAQDQDDMDKMTLRTLSGRKLLGPDYLYSGCSLATVLGFSSKVTPGAIYCVGHEHIAASNSCGLDEYALKYTLFHTDGVLVVYCRSRLECMLDEGTYRVSGREAIRAIVKFKGYGFQYGK